MYPVNQEYEGLEERRVSPSSPEEERVCVLYIRNMKDGRRGRRRGCHHGGGGEGHHGAADGGVGVQAAHTARQKCRVDGGQPRK